jgi:tetratricopeptide (TPR) repeat protein
MKKRLLTLIGLIFIFSTNINSQDFDGYWDKDRATYKEIKLCPGCKTWQRTDEFPIGTTEIIYRITLLDENQQLSSSLSSVLSVIPDPSGISQGTAGAIKLLSKVSGSDKCKFTIFSSYQDAQNFIENGNFQTGCYIHNGDVTRYAGRLSLSNSSCLQKSPKNLWFGFRSLNLFMNEKIILEVIPWVDHKASRGWTKDIKESVIKVWKNTISVEDLSNPDRYFQCLLDKLENNYKFQDIQKMTTSELEKVIETFEEECYVETGEMKYYIDQLRVEALRLGKLRKYSEAIAKLNEIISYGNPTAMDYNNIGLYYIFTKQYLKAIKFLKEGEKIDGSELLIKGNLAHAYLFNEDIDIAKELYTKYKQQNVTDNISWVDKIKFDFNEFIKVGLPSQHFEEILFDISQAQKTIE